MLTSSFWIEAGLVNGAVGSMNAICYTSGDGSPHFLVAVMVCFDGYSVAAPTGVAIFNVDGHTLWLSLPKATSKTSIAQLCSSCSRPSKSCSTLSSIKVNGWKEVAREN